MSLSRLKRRSEFLRVAESRQSFATHGVVLQVRCAGTDRGPQDGGPRDERAGDQGAIRYGLTVSRRVGKAVVRNRARRRLRAVAERILPLYARPGCDYVLIGRAATVSRPFPRLMDDVTRALKRLRVYRRPAPDRDS